MELSSSPLSENSEEKLRNTFLSVDKQLEEFEYMGCTGTCVFVWEHLGKRFVQAANVGDSTAFLKSNSLGVVWLTRGMFYGFFFWVTLR